MLTANPLIALLDPDEHNPDTYNDVWETYAARCCRGYGYGYGYERRRRTARMFPAFAAIVLTVTGDAVVRCNDCESVVLEYETTDYQGEPVCESCQDDYYSCDDCGCTVHGDDTCYLDGLDRTVCDPCRDGYYWCESCESYSTDGGCEYCKSGGCDCESHAPKFRFPANGAGTIGNDERMTLTLPKGVISEAGIAAISQAVTAALPTKQAEADAHAAYSARYSVGLDPYSAETYALRDAWFAASDEHSRAVREAQKAIDSVGDEWQGRRGNYPKRLSSALHKIGVKLAPATISEVGNLARQYSDEQSEFHLEFTRDLNQSADYFYHEDSCWWQSYANSRCALKNWGGLAMRTFHCADDPQDSPSGRVFLFPLDEDFKPTQNAETAHAYMVFNAYGALGGYSSARIIAHLAGKTYRKVTFGLNIPDGYVNSSAGYLVCDAETIGDAPAEFSFGGDSHLVVS